MYSLTKYLKIYFVHGASIPLLVNWNDGVGGIDHNEGASAAAPLLPWGGERFFLVVNTKMHFSEQKFNVRKCKTMRLDESYRLVTTVLVLNSHCGKIHSIFPTTIASAFSFQPR
jgi:hypothetical protein